DSYSRMEDCELVLRFFAYKSACKHNIAKSTMSILDLYAERAKEFTEKDIYILEELFYKTLDLVYSIFGEIAFKSEVNSRKSEKMIYDAIMLSCAELIEEGYEQYMRKLCPDKLMKYKFECIEQNRKIFNGKYTSIKNVKERIEIIKSGIRGHIDEL
ncbi:MAG: hypothetical protein ACRCXT_13270, partial [Paraclostridium sp.]